LQNFKLKRIVTYHMIATACGECLTKAWSTHTLHGDYCRRSYSHHSRRL